MSVASSSFGKTIGLRISPIAEGGSIELTPVCLFVAIVDLSGMRGKSTKSRGVSKVMSMLFVGGPVRDCEAVGVVVVAVSVCWFLVTGLRATGVLRSSCGGWCLRFFRRVS